MRNKPRQRSSAQRARKFRVVLYGGALAVFAAALAACGGGGSDEARGVIIVNAPVAGEVRRVLVREGMVVNEGTPIVEIAVRTEAQSAPQPSAEDPVARSR